MFNRKEVGTSSDCSEVHNPEKFYDFFNVQLNRAPFYDFFATEDKCEAKSEEKFIPESNTCDLSLSLSLPYSNYDPVINQSNSDKSENTTNVASIIAVPITAAVPLNVYIPYATKDIKWTLKKTLTVSDCNDQHRLLIGKKLMEDHILPHLNESSRCEINTLNGLRVNVFDCDIGIQVKLTLKKWPTAKYYGLMDNWKRDFVNRRRLIPGDEVGLSWDEDCKRLLFSVLKKWYD